MADTISIAGLSKAAVLAALYNASAPQGMGFLHYDATPMTETEAQGLLVERQQRPYFDYLKGRVMKIDLSSDDIDARLYDRDHGPGAAERAISALIASGSPNSLDTQVTHQANKAAAAQQVRATINEPGRMSSIGAVPVFTMGLADVAEVLAPAVDRAFEQGDDKR